MVKPPPLYPTSVLLSPTPHAAVSNPPTIASLTRVTDTTLEVRWRQPQPEDLGITGYLIYYAQFAAPDVSVLPYVEVKGRDTSRTTIEALEPNAIYAVRMRAKYSENNFGKVSDIKIESRQNPSKYQLPSVIRLLPSYSKFSIHSFP